MYKPDICSSNLIMPENKMDFLLMNLNHLMLAWMT